MNRRAPAILLLLASAAAFVAAPADARRHERHERPVAPRRFAPTPAPADREREQLARTREVLEGGRERLQGCGDTDAARLLESAGDMQARAEQAADAGRLLAALQLTMGARVRVQRALERCNVAEDDRETARRTLQRTDTVLERLRGGGAPGGAAGELLTTASETQERARRAYAEGRLEESVQQSLTARAWALRAVRAGRHGR